MTYVERHVKKAKGTVPGGYKKEANTTGRCTAAKNERVAVRGE